MPRTVSVTSATTRASTAATPGVARIRLATASGVRRAEANTSAKRASS
jgi:hypothetical protein